MDAMNTNPLLDCKTMLAILNADPDGVAIIGAWNSMETLAREDPEGCVRLSPGLPMDNTALAGLLRCRETIVEKTVAVFEKLKRVAVKDGLIKVLDINETKPFKQNVIPYEKTTRFNERVVCFMQILTNKKSVTGDVPITDILSYSVLDSTSDHAGFFFVMAL